MPREGLVLLLVCSWLAAAGAAAAVEAASYGESVGAAADMSNGHGGGHGNAELEKNATMFCFMEGVTYEHRVTNPCEPQHRQCAGKSRSDCFL